MLLLLKIVESCADPGQRATRLIKFRSALHMPWTFTEKYRNRFRNTSGSSPP